MLNKKIITLILSSIIVIGTFVSCGNGTSSVSTNNEVSQSEEGKSKEEKDKEDETKFMEYILDIKNKSQSLENYMRNPEEIKDEKFVCGIEVIDVKTDNNGDQIIYGEVLEPRQFDNDYNEYSDENIKNVFIKYNSNKFDGNRALKGDIVVFGGLYSEIYSDTLDGQRVEAPMFLAELRADMREYLKLIAMNQFLSSIGQRVSDLNFENVSEDDLILSKLLEENYNYDENYIPTYYKDKNEVYWILNIVEDPRGLFVSIDSANKNSEGNYELKQMKSIKINELEF